MPISPYDPAYGAIPVPEAGVFEEPTIRVCINPEWAAYIDGAMSRLLRHTVWLGTPEEQEAAVQQVRQFLAALQERIPCGEIMTAPIVTEIDITPESVFPLLLKSAIEGETIDEVLLTVDSAWDAGVISVGDDADHDRLLPAAYGVLDTERQIQASPQYRYSAGTDVNIYLIGAPTTGSARVTLYSYQEA